MITGINLLPWRELRLQQQKKHYSLLVLLTIVAAVISVMAFNLLLAHKIQRQHNIVNKLRITVATLKRQETQYNLITAKQNIFFRQIKIFTALTQQQSSIATAFEKLALIIPKGIFIKELQFQENHFVLTGNSHSHNQIALLIATIEKTAKFGPVTLHGIQSESNSTYNFNLSFPTKLQLVS